MTITAGSALGTATSTATASSFALTTSATVAVGEIAVIVVAKQPEESNNTGVTVTDSAGNTWTRLVEKQGSNGTSGVYFTRATSELASGGSITATFVSGAYTAVALTGNVFNTTTAVYASATSDVGTGGSSTAMVSLSLNPAETEPRLYVRGVAIKATSGSMTASTGFTTMTSAVASTGTVDTSVGVGAEYRIRASGIGTSDPAWSVAGTNVGGLGAILERMAAGSLFFGPF